MATKTKRYILYRAKRGSNVLDEWSANQPVQPVNDAFFHGKLSTGRAVDDLPNPEDGEIWLDSSTGKIAISILGRTTWFRPSHPCPDCDGKLELTKKFIKRMGHPASPWMYLCSNNKNSNNPDKSGACDTMFPANKAGDINGDMPDAKTRFARSETTKVFDRLWKKAPDVESWAGDPAELKAVLQKAKQRAYRYLAKKMEEKGQAEGNIAKMDIPTCRIAYAICRDADLNDVVKFT